MKYEKMVIMLMINNLILPTVLNIISTIDDKLPSSECCLTRSTDSIR